jgi:3-dehydroquinate synthase class II
VPGLVAQAREEMTVQLEHEIARLKELQKVNRSVQPEEVELLIQQHKALDQHLSGARLRLDAIRLIQRGPGLTVNQGLFCKKRFVIRLKSSSQPMCKLFA